MGGGSGGFLDTKGGCCLLSANQWGGLSIDGFQFNATALTDTTCTELSTGRSRGFGTVLP